MSQCCSTADCTGTGEQCVQGPTYPQCGGAFMMPYEACAAPQCSTAADCTAQPHGICMPAGSHGYSVATCLYGGCTIDSDCPQEPGGSCRLVQNPCCSAVYPACVYPGGCSSNADCAPNSHCESNGDRADCVVGPALCPP
jgi:hypothetical protein